MGVTLAVLFSSSLCFAVKEYYGTNRSVRALGMGGAFYGLSDDEYAVFYNPAGLSTYKGYWHFNLAVQGEVAPDTLSAINTLTGQTNSTIDSIATNLTQFAGKPLYAGVSLYPYFYKRHFALGVLLASPKIDIAVLGRDLDTSIDLTAISDSGMFLSSAWEFGRGLHIGATLKGIYRAGGTKLYSLLDLAQGSAYSLKDIGGAGAGVDFDLGTTYEFPRPWIGSLGRMSLVFNNLLASQFPIARIEGAPPGLVRTVSVGWVTAFKGIGWIDSFNCLVDFAEFSLGGETNPDKGARTGSFWKHVNWGLEIPIAGRLFLRGGFHQGNWTSGLGLQLPMLKLDLATYAEELASGVDRLTSRRYALRISLGGIAAAPSIFSDPAGENDAVKAEETLREKVEKEMQKDRTKPVAVDPLTLSAGPISQAVEKLPERTVEHFGIEKMIQEPGIPK